MRNVCTITAFFLLLCAAPFCYGQNNKETAVSKAQQAIKLEDEEGKYDEAIKLFREAQGLDPENITYPYEIAYAYTGKKEYKTAEIPFGIAVGRTDMGIADKGEMKGFDLSAEGEGEAKKRECGSQDFHWGKVRRETEK